MALQGGGGPDRRPPLTATRAQVRGCFNKTAYATEALAREVAVRCTEERGREIRVYKCETWDHWHLTKAPAEATARCGACLEPMPDSGDWQCTKCKEMS